MKTLNERVYESLLAFDKPVTLSQLNVAEDLKNVPRMALGESLRGLCGEQIVSYRMKNGKIYFSADPKYGECQNPSQKNLQSLSSALGGLAGLASLLGGMNGGEGGSPGISSADEDEIEEYSSEWDDITFENGKRIHGEGYSICIPAGCSCVDTDEGHDAVVSYPEGVSEDDELMHMMVGKPNIQNVMAEFPQDLIGTFAELVMWQMHNTVAQGKSPIVAVGNKTKGYLLDADSNYILQLPVPSGIQTLRIDLMNQAPKTLMRRIIGEWLDTYECEMDFPGAKPFDDKEYFSKEGIHKFVADVEKAAEYRIRLRQQRDEITERKLECLKAGGYKSATKFIMEERATYQAVADAQSDALAQMLETVTYYKSLGLTEEEYFNIMWVVQAYLYGLVPMKTIDLPDGNLGAYNSPTDIAISFKQNSGVQIDVGAMPKHYEELFAFASVAVPSGENVAIYRERNSVISDAIRRVRSKNQEQYNAEFKMEGSMLAAYLGDAEHVIVPDGTAVISDTAFANCRNLKTVELPEGVAQIGYAAFENCPNLQSIKMPDSITSMFPALFGYDAFGKKKPKFIVYKDSYAEEFAKEHEIPYEVIREDNLDNVFKYEEGRRDVVAGLSVLVPDGFATSEQLTSAEKLKFKDTEGTSHLYYAAVSADADGNFTEYKNVSASFTIAGTPTKYEDAADEMNVESILGRLNTPHKNETYKIETLKKNKLVVAYDMGNSGIENGTPWVMYPVFVFTRKHVIPIQFFFNDHYTDRQHNLAVKQWIKGIIDEETLREQERKRKAEEKCKHKQEEEKRIAEEKKKQEIEENKVIVQKCLDQIEEYKTQVKLAVNEKKNRTTAGIMQRIEQLKVEKQSHEATLKSLGLFSFSDKKREKEEIARIETEIEMLSKPDYLSEKLKKIQQNGDASVKKYKADVEDFLAKKYNLDYKQKKAKIDIKAVNAKEMKNDRYATDSTKKNNLMQLEILKIVYDANKKMTISDIVEQLEKSKDNVSIHLVRAFVCQLKYDNYLKRSENKGYEYFAITDSAIKRLKSAEPTELEKTAEPYVENKFYSKQKCPEMPIIEEVI